MTATPLHRHQLAWLTPGGWQRLRQLEWDETARECLAHWAGHALPLVVTRQSAVPEGVDDIAMGLPAPGRWARRRIVLQVARVEVSYFDEFPRARQVTRLLPEGARVEWQRLCERLHSCGVVARVHGSHGWQHLTGLDHVRPGSDIDLWIRVSDADQADEVVRHLQSFHPDRPRLDGELVFEGGNAVAWREWLAWRAGRAKTMLVKRLDGTLLSEGLGLKIVAAEAVG